MASTAVGTNVPQSEPPAQQPPAQQPPAQQPPPLVYVERQPQLANPHVPMKAPTLIQEAIAGSHIDVWKTPVFSKWGMFAFTLFFGGFGLHYVMLRAPILAVLFVIVNSLTWGYWWYYDLIQLAFTSVEDLNLHGMGSPFLFQYAVAVGMWTGGSTPGAKLQRGGELKGKTIPAVESPSSTGTTSIPKKKDNGDVPLADRVANFVEKILSMILGLFSKPPEREPLTLNEKKVIQNPFTHSLWVFLFLLFAPIGPVSSAIAGDMWSAILHIFDPLMFITFFFNAIQAIVNPLDFFISGVYRPLFYRMLNFGFEMNGQSTFLQMAKIPDTREVPNLVEPPVELAKDLGGILGKASEMVPAAGLGGAAMSAAGSLAATAKAGAAATQATVGSIEADARKKQAEAKLIEAQAAALLAKTGASTNTSEDKVSNGIRQAKLPSNTNKIDQTGSLLPQASGLVQRGGGSKNTSDSLSLGVIGAVLVGGLLLGVSRNGFFQGKDDSPPNAGRV